MTRLVSPDSPEGGTDLEAGARSAQIPIPAGVDDLYLHEQAAFD